VALVARYRRCGSRLGGVYTGEGLGGLIREQFSPRAIVRRNDIVARRPNAGLTRQRIRRRGRSPNGDLRRLPLHLCANRRVFVWALTVLGSYSRARAGCSGTDTGLSGVPNRPAFLGHPNGHEVLTNLVSPHFPASHAFLVLAVALIGTTITPYMQF